MNVIVRLPISPSIKEYSACNPRNQANSQTIDKTVVIEELDNRAYNPKNEGKHGNPKHK